MYIVIVLICANNAKTSYHQLSIGYKYISVDHVVYAIYH